MTCKECIHYDACCKIGGKLQEHYMNKCNNVECECFKDKSRFIELPCKVGDAVYRIFGMQIYECFVGEIVLKKEYTYFVCWGGSSNNLEDFGETVFLTREEAEKKLEEIKNEREN